MSFLTATTSATTAKIVNNPIFSALAATYGRAFETWGSKTLTFTMNQGDANPDGEPVGAWTSALSDAIRMAQADVSAVCGLTFTEVADARNGTDNADIDYWYYDKPADPTAGYSYGVDGPGVFLNADSVYVAEGNTADGMTYGGINYGTVIHELLHNLGLSHPHDDFANLPGVTSYDDTGTYRMNQSLYSVMSYNRVDQTDAEGTETTGYPFTFSTVDRSFSVLGTFDIAMLQLLYGANMQTATGNDVYELAADNVSGTHYKAIWDAGGTDEIRFTGLRDTRIDLRAATLDLADGMRSGGVLSTAAGVYGGYTIAQGVVIENATGGNARDLITGNDADNLLKGRGGDDTISGAVGRDTIEGGDGRDNIKGGLGVDFVEGGAGADTMSGDAGGDWLEYDGSNGGVTVNLTSGRGAGAHAEGDIFTGFEHVLGSVYGDVLTGNALANVIFGGHGNDTIKSSDGNDIVRGGAGADVMHGGFGDDWLDYRGSAGGVSVNIGRGTASGGHAQGDRFSGFERVFGSAGNDSLVGSGGDNVLYGMLGSDTLLGGEGNDTLRGGSGGDVLNGGGGIDMLDYGGSRQAVTVDLGLRTVSGGDAEGDTILHFEYVTGSTYGDNLRGNGAGNLLSGESGQDTIDGASGNDVVRGGAGADVLRGGVGDDWLDYRTSRGAVQVDLSTRTVSGGEAEGDNIFEFERIYGTGRGDHLTGTMGDNVIRAGGGNDTLHGQAGDDLLEGQAGNDVFNFGAGSDTMNGGGGDDRAIFKGASSAYTIVDNGGGSWRVTHIPTGDVDVLISVETLQFHDLILA